MSRRIQIILLVILLGVLAGVLYLNRTRTQAAPTVAAVDEKFVPINVENPSLRFDLLERIRKFKYAGQHRNIFSASLPPPPALVGATKASQMTPALPPPLELPMKFFGYAAYLRTGHRLAFFTDGEDVFILSEGQTLLGRFRLLRISNTTAEVEEMASGRRATLMLEEPTPAS